MKLSLQEAIAFVTHGDHLSSEQAAEAFGVVMRGEATADQIRELLVGLKSKGETADEVAGAAQALRSAMIRLPVAGHRSQVLNSGPAIRDLRPLVDTCGTGGGTVTTFNISTTAAFVAAGAGVPIAKHGNRSFTSRSGSADVLEALGVDIALTPERAAEVLAEVGLVFLFAPNYHPAMRHVAPVRKELKTATIMNLLGPLANPAGVTRQVLGVSEAARGPLVAEALGRLGAVHALVVYAEAGMDEISPAGVTHVWEVGSSRAGHRHVLSGSEGSQVTGHSAPGITEWDLRPETFDLRHDDLGALKGGEPAENAERLEQLLSDASTDPAGRAAVLLNAAAAIYVSGPEMEFGDAIAAAQKALVEGRALRVLEALKNSARRA